LNVAVKPLRDSAIPAVELPWNRPWLKVILGLAVGQLNVTSTVGLEVP